MSAVLFGLRAGTARKFRCALQSVANIAKREKYDVTDVKTAIYARMRVSQGMYRDRTITWEQKCNSQRMRCKQRCARDCEQKKWMKLLSGRARYMYNACGGVSARGPYAHDYRDEGA